MIPNRHQVGSRLLFGIPSQIPLTIIPLTIGLFLVVCCPAAIPHQGAAARDQIRGAKLSRLAPPIPFPIPSHFRAGPAEREYHFAATATDASGLESDYSNEAVAWFTNRVQTVTCAWDPSPSTGIVNYTLYQGPKAATYTNHVSAGTNLTATIRLNPAPATNLVLLISSSGLTNIQYRAAPAGKWTLLGSTNLCVTNPILGNFREWRGLGRPAANKQLRILSRWQ